MKTATIPSLRVDPKLRQAAEDVLKEGENLSGFVEQSIRAQIERRRAQEAFLARGMAAREDARRSGEYVSATEVLEALDETLRQAEAKTKTD